MPAPRPARTPAAPALRRRRPLPDDVARRFPVLEAILVAVLVLTAILFFTSVQRPSTGSEQGGIDLAKVSADTLAILRARTFTINGGSQTLEGWVTNVTKGDATTASGVDAFLKQVLPAGSRYSLRLDNGVGTLQILPTGTPAQPFEGRAASIVLSPNWATFRNDTATNMRVVTPGAVIAAGDALMTQACFEAPFASSTAPGGTSWAAYWQSAVQSTTPTTNGKDTTAVLGSSQQVPKGVPLGKWKLGTTTTSGHCTGTITYLDVAPPGSRAVAASSGSTTLTGTAGTAEFGPSDVGLAVAGNGIPSGAYISAVASSTSATLSSAATATGTVLIAPNPTYTPYLLQLVVWFGA